MKRRWQSVRPSATVPESADSQLSIAQALGRLGDHGRAEPLLRQALAVQQSLNNRWWEGLVRNELGILYMMVRRSGTGASEPRGEPADQPRNRDERGQAYSLCNLGQVLRDAGRLAEAEEMLLSALGHAQQQGDRHLEAICHSDLAMVNLAAGKSQAAIEQATVALEQFTKQELHSATTADLGTLALAHMQMDQQEKGPLLRPPVQSAARRQRRHRSRLPPSRLLGLFSGLYPLL